MTERDTDYVKKASGNADFCHQALNITGDMAITATAIALAPETGGLSLGAEALLMAGTRLAVSGAVYSIGEGLKGQALDGKYDWSFGNLIKEAAIGSTIGLTGHLGPELLFGRIGAGAAGESVAQLVSSGGWQAIDKDAAAVLTKQLATVFGKSAVSGQAPAASALAPIVSRVLAYLPKSQQAEIVETIAGQSVKFIPQSVSKELVPPVAQSAIKIGISTVRFKAVEAGVIGGANVATTVAITPFTGHLTVEDIGMSFATGAAAGLALPAAGKLLAAVDKSAGGVFSRGAEKFVGNIAGKVRDLGDVPSLKEHYEHFQKKFSAKSNPAGFKSYGLASDARFPAAAKEVPASVMAELKANANLLVAEVGTNVGTKAVSHVFDAGSNNKLYVEYVLDERGTKPVPNKIVMKDPEGSNLAQAPNTTWIFTKEAGGWYRSHTTTSAEEMAGYTSNESKSVGRELIGTEARVNADNSLTLTGKGEGTKIGAGSSSYALDSLTHRTDGSVVRHYADNTSRTLDAFERTEEMVALNGTRFKMHYDDNGKLNKLDAGQKTYTRGIDGIWLDQEGKPFAHDISITTFGPLVIKPAETFRIAECPERQVDSLTETINGKLEVRFKDRVPLSVKLEQGPKPPTSAEILELRIARGDLVRQADGTFLDTGTTGETVRYDAHGVPISTTDAHNFQQEFKYKDGQLQEIEGTIGGSPYLTISRQENGQWIEQNHYRKTSADYFHVSVAEDGTVSKFAPDWRGERKRPDGLFAVVREDTSEVISARFLEPERSRIEKIMTALTGNVEQSQRFLTNVEAFQKRALRREPALSAEEIANTYYQMDKLLSTDSAILPLAQRVRLAEQFMLEIAHPEMISQGAYGTCNVTAEFQNRMFTSHPADAARLLTDVATTGRFIHYGDGTIIDMSQMNNVLTPSRQANNPIANQFRPGSIDDLKIDGQRNFMDQLFQSTVLESYWQRLKSEPESKVAVRAASTIFDLRSGQPFCPGDLHYELASQGEFSDYIADYSTGKPTYLDDWKSRAVQDPISGLKVTMKELLPRTNSGLTTKHILDLQSRLTRSMPSEYPHFLGRDLSGTKTTVGVDTAVGLTAELQKMKAEGVLPATVIVDTHDPLFTRLPEIKSLTDFKNLKSVVEFTSLVSKGILEVKSLKNPSEFKNLQSPAEFKNLAKRLIYDYGGGHVINAQNIFEQDGKWMVELTNQWKGKYNYLGVRAVPVEDLFRAMKARPADGSSGVVNEIIISGAAIGTAVLGTAAIGASWLTEQVSKNLQPAAIASNGRTGNQRNSNRNPREFTIHGQAHERGAFDIPLLRDY